MGLAPLAKSSLRELEQQLPPRNGAFPETWKVTDDQRHSSPRRHFNTRACLAIPYENWSTLKALSDFVSSISAIYASRCGSHPCKADEERSINDLPAESRDIARGAPAARSVTPSQPHSSAVEVEEVRSQRVDPAFHHFEVRPTNPHHRKKSTTGTLLSSKAPNDLSSYATLNSITPILPHISVWSPATATVIRKKELAGFLELSSLSGPRAEHIMEFQEILQEEVITEQLVVISSVLLRFDEVDNSVDLQNHGSLWRPPGVSYSPNFPTWEGDIADAQQQQPRSGANVLEIHCSHKSRKEYTFWVLDL